MDAQDAIDLGREAIRTCLLIGGPILAVSLLVSLALGVVQAMTQVQDQTVSFVPKLLIVLAAIAVGLPWLSDHLVDFSQEVLGKPILMANVPEAPAYRTAFLPNTSPKRQRVSPSARPRSPQNRPRFIQAAYPGVQPKPPANQAPPATDWDPSAEPTLNTPPKSPFQLPHYRFSKKLTDDLEG